MSSYPGLEQLQSWPPEVWAAWAQALLSAAAIFSAAWLARRADVRMTRRRIDAIARLVGYAYVSTKLIRRKCVAEHAGGPAEEISVEMLNAALASLQAIRLDEVPEEALIIPVSMSIQRTLYVLKVVERVTNRTSPTGRVEAEDIEDLVDMTEALRKYQVEVVELARALRTWPERLVISFRP